MLRSSALPLFALTFLLLLGIGLWFDRGLLPRLREQNERLARLESQSERIERSLSLLHFSAEIVGQPLDRVLDHLEFWATKRDESKPSIIDEGVYEEKLSRGTQALQSLGASVMPRLVQEFRSRENLEKNGYRMVLLRAMRDIDSKEALQVYRQVVQNAGLDSRFRTEAARMLVELDANFAAGILQQVLLLSTKGGLRHQDPSMESTLRRNFPGYDEILRYYMRTPHSARYDTLVSILNTRGYDIATYNNVIRQLGELGNKDAVPLLKERFEAGPLSHETMNPYFRRLCAETIVRLEGTEACGWLKTKLRVERDRTMQSVLSSLISKHCP